MPSKIQLGNVSNLSYETHQLPTENLRNQLELYWKIRTILIILSVKDLFYQDSSEFDVKSHMIIPTSEDVTDAKILITIYCLDLET